MEQLNYWAAFCGTGKIQDYLQYVSHKTDGFGRPEEHRDGTENQGTHYQRTDNSGE